ncbi:carbohydrate ABC transporter permease [Inquilinus sp.]|uniref:carbohydrate ABC transporter permease n=1 Tax=Inquilinus sp. TaxID=1932117 RepID=UPI0031DCFD4F
MFPKPIETWRPGLRRAYRAAVPAALLLWMLPILAVIVTSLRGRDDLLRGNYWGWPTRWQLLDNYQAVFTQSPMATYLANSLFLCLAVVTITLVLASMAAFVLANYEFPGARLLFLLMLAGNFLPAQLLMIPVRDIVVALGLFDTRWALILVQVALGGPFAAFFLRNFIRDLPRELTEAARCEGATEFQIYRRVVLPLLRPAMAALAVLIFTFVWNDYFWALVLVQSDGVRPITIGLAQLKGAYSTQWNLVAAASILAAIPPIVLFFVMQKQFIAGLAMGATKG